jgi:WD40 repeat protein
MSTRLSPACLTALLLSAQLPAAAPPSPLLDAYGDPLPAGARLRLGSERLRYPGVFRRMALSPDGSTAATSVQGGIVLWDVKSGVRKKWIPADDPFHLAYSPDGKLLVGRWGEQRIAFWDAEGKLIASPGTLGGNVWGVAFSAKGKNLVVGAGRKLRVWNPNTRREVRSVSLPLHPRVDPVELALAPDGKHALVVTDKARDITDRWFVEVAGGKLIWKGDAESRSQDLAAFSPDGRSLAVANRDCSLSMIEASSGKVRSTLKGGQRTPSALVFSRDGKQLVSGHEGGEIRLWDLAKKEAVKERGRRDEAVKGLAFTPDTKALVAAISDSHVSALRVWDQAS